MTNERINMRFKLAGALSLHIVPVRMFLPVFMSHSCQRVCMFFPVCCWVCIMTRLLINVKSQSEIYTAKHRHQRINLLEIQSLPDGLVYSLSGLVSTGSVSEILILLCGPYSGVVYDPFLFVLHKRGYVRWGLPRLVWFRPPFPFPVCAMLQSFSSWAL